MDAQEAELKMTITVTRKETGKVEEYTLTAIPIKEGEENGSNTHNSIPQSGS